MSNFYNPYGDGPVVKDASEATRWKSTRPPYTVSGPYCDGRWSVEGLEGGNALLYRRSGITATTTKKLAKEIARLWNKKRK